MGTSDHDPSFRIDHLQSLVTYRLSRLQARLNAQAQKLLEEHAGLSLSEWRVAVVLREAGEMSSADLVRLTQYDKAQISRNVGKLRGKGLVMDGGATQDQRVTRITLTQAGVAAIDKALPVMRERQGKLMAGLTVAEQQALFDTIEKISDNIDRAEIDKGGAP